MFSYFFFLHEDIREDLWHNPVPFFFPIYKI